MICEHEFMDMISEIYQKGKTDFMLYQCVACSLKLEIEVN